MARKKKTIKIEEQQTIFNKIPNEKILDIAASLGMITTDKFETLKEIGESKQVEELLKGLSTEEQEKLIDTLKKLDKDDLIDIK